MCCPGAEGTLGSPGPHLRCRQLGPCLCPPQGLGGSSFLQPLPRAPPLPLKPLVTQLPPSCSSTTRSCTGTPGAVDTPSCSGWGFSCSPAGRQPTLPALPGPLTPQALVSSSMPISAPASPRVGATTSPACCSSPLHPAPARPVQRLPVGHKSVLESYLPPDGPTSSCTLGPQAGHGSPNGTYTVVPGSRPPYPSTPTSLAAPLPALPGARAAPCCGHTHLVPGSTTMVGLRMPGWPSCQPLFCGPGSLQPSPPCGWGHRGSLGHMWDSGTCLW